MQFSCPPSSILELLELNCEYPNGVWALDCVHELKKLTEISKGKLSSSKKSLVEHNCSFLAFRRPYQHVSVFWERDLML